MRRSLLSNVVSELKADKRELPYGIDIYEENGSVVVGSRDWNLGFAILKQSSMEDYHETFDRIVPHLIQQIQYKASIH